MAKRRARFGGAVRAATLESHAFLAVVLLQLLVSAVICAAAQRPMFAGPADAYGTFLGAAALFGLMALAIALFRRRQLIGGETPSLDVYRLAWHALRSDTLTPEYLANVAIIFVTAPLAISAFSAAKQSIPLVHPFSWDGRIAAWGAAIHGGAHLWVWMQPILAHPRITVAMDWFYHRFWTTIMLGAFVAAAFFRPSALRRQFLVAFVLLFLVVGTVGALALSSAGPAYYALVVGASSDPYGPLLSYLHSVNRDAGLLSVRGEGALWLAYTHHLEGFGYGVSAMPSVHVASATLTALFGFAIARLLGIILSVIAVCTLIASVNLGWHYSLDGYVGAVLACCIWWASGRVTRDAVASAEAQR